MQQYSYSAGSRCIWSMGINSAQAGEPRGVLFWVSGLSLWALTGRRLVPGSNCRARRRLGSTTGNQRPLGFGDTGTFCGPEIWPRNVSCFFSNLERARMSIWKGEHFGGGKPEFSLIAFWKRQQLEAKLPRRKTSCLPVTCKASPAGLSISQEAGS